MFVFDEWVKHFTVLAQKVRDDSEKSQIKCSFSLCCKLEALIASHTSLVLPLTYARITSGQLDAKSGALCKVILCIHVCRSNQYNRSSTQLISSSLALFCATELLPSDKKQKVQRAIYKHFKAMKYDLACSVLHLSQLLSSSDLLYHAQRAKLRPWQWFAVAATYLVGYRKQAWDEKLCDLLNALPPWYRNRFYTLLDYPSFVAPGTIVTYDNSAAPIIDITKTTFVINCNESLDSVPHHHCVATDKMVEDMSAFDEAVKKLERRQMFSPSFKVDRPPAALLNIIKQTNAVDFDLDALITHIESEPSFSVFIRNSASETNRLNLTVTSLKQAVMTYGSQRLADVLITHALFERLIQKDFPLRQAFIEHVSLCSVFASTIAKHTGVMLPQSASLLSVLCYSTLFTEPALKLNTRWELVRSDLHQPLSRVFNSKALQKVRLSSLALAKAWGISSNHLTLLNFLLDPASKTNHKAAALMRLASFWAFEAKEGKLTFTISDSAFEQKTCKTLALTNVQKQTFMEMSQGLMVCSLHA
jgi:HD-like signal output (HDOD) protein